MVCTIFREKSSYSFQDFLRKDKYYPKIAHAPENKNEVHDKLSFFHTLNDRNWNHTKRELKRGSKNLRLKKIGNPVKRARYSEIVSIVNSSSREGLGDSR